MQRGRLSGVIVCLVEVATPVAVGTATNAKAHTQDKTPITAAGVWDLNRSSVQRSTSETRHEGTLQLDPSPRMQNSSPGSAIMMTIF